MEKIVKEDLPALFYKFKNAMSENRGFLIDLDSKVGDSDLGLTMDKAFSAAAASVAENRSDAIGEIFMEAGMAMAQSAPSTMGTLIATGFMRGGKVLEGIDSITTSKMSDFWQAFLVGIEERGKAKPGDKTVIDVLGPVVKSLQNSVANGLALPVAMDASLIAAKQGLEDTKNMIARHGKAACFGDTNIGHQDAGATVAVLLIESVNEFVLRAKE